jgi:NDP-sugar pyrophosphorylase family protein/aminoglycoside/choline kinase family phosphotransferase
MMARTSPHPSRPTLSPPTRAVILAAGLGTRLDPLTREIPKALLPFQGITLLERALRMMESWGVRDVLVNCHAHADQIVRALSTRASKDLRVQISLEPEIRGTGGVLSYAAWFLSGDPHPFWMLNADVVAELEPSALLRRAPRGKSIAALWMEPLRGPRTVEMQRQTVRTFRSKHPGGAGTFTFCGLQLLSPRILSYIPPGFSTIIEAYEAAIADGWRVTGSAVPGSFWADVGTSEQYLDAHCEIAEHGRCASGSVRGEFRDTPGDNNWVDPAAHVDSRAVLHDTVVMKNARLGPRARCRNAMVGPGTRVNGTCEGLVTRAAACLTPAEQGILKGIPIRTESAWVEQNRRSGSARSFHRISDGKRSVILVRYDMKREENALYAGHAVLLRRAGVRVPVLYVHDRKQQLLVLEDVGRGSIEDLVPGWSSRKKVRIYRKILEQVYRFHREGSRLAKRQRAQLMPRFDPSLYRWEHELLDRRFLEPRGVPAALRRVVRRELEMLSKELNAAPEVMIHRDLQSSNILMHRGEPVFIDFQGMRLGPAAYDVASLICDPYVMLSRSEQNGLVDQYASFGRNAARSMDFIWPAAVQRLSQALGAYGRLGGLDRGKRFLGYIPPACAMMRRVAEQCEAPTSGLLEAIHVALIQGKEPNVR